MDKIGYARVSTRDQNLARQIEQLHDSGVNKIFQEKLSGKNADRPQLKAMLDYIRDDNEVVVLSLDRFGRNSHDLTDIIETIRRRGAQLNVLNLPSFASIEDPNLRNLITTIIVELYKYIAQEERETIKIRQQQGIEIAKRQGKYKKSQHFFGQFAKRLFVKLGHTRKAMLLVQDSLSVLVPLRGCKRVCTRISDRNIRELIYPKGVLKMTYSRNRYDQDFKKNAVRLSFNSSKPVKIIASELGVPESALYRWRKLYPRLHN